MEAGSTDRERPAIGPLLGAGKVAEAFAYGTDVLKLYRDPAARSQAFAEAAVLAMVADHPVPSPAVFEAGQYAGRWGLVMARAAGQSLGTLAEADPGRIPDLLEAMVRLHLRVHACTEPRLPPLKRRLAHRMAKAPGLERERDALLATLTELPDGNRLCHGDFHAHNLIGTPETITIVDWPDASSGPPAADACRSYLLILPHVPDAAEAYLAAYARASGITEASIRAWLPVLAAARLVENVPDEEPLLRRLATGAPI